MKNLIGCILTIASINAFACPKLEGTYLGCYSEMGIDPDETTQIVSQSVANGQTTYTVVNDALKKTILTENETIEIRENFDPDMGLDMVLSLAISCTDNKLIATATGARAERQVGSNVSDEELNMASELVSQMISGLKTEYKINADGNLQSDEVVDGEILNTTICTKLY